MENFFKFKEHNTNLKTEVTAGATTFMTMAYIIFVNPFILSAAGMDFGAVMTATIIAAGVTTILMGLLTNYPFALASGMGLKRLFRLCRRRSVWMAGSPGGCFYFRYRFSDPLDIRSNFAH
jgi:adenine/guanine/hypoxanthine permease